MHRKYLVGWLFLVITALVLLSVGGTAQAAVDSTPKVQLDNNKFKQLSRELERMHEVQLFKGGKKERKPGKEQPVSFDVENARKQKFSEESIALAQEIAIFTNDLLTAIPNVDGSIENVRVDIQRYTNLAAYFEAANNYVDAMSQSQSIKADPSGVHTMGNGFTSGCGYYTNPKPSRAAPWVDRSSANPAQTLESWGYHATPDLVGGGYTRPQTWRWYECGFSTYRDHAYITGSTTFREQSYVGWEPNGEPNPEVYRSGPWPYSDWPAYVYWWHSKF